MAPPNEEPILSLDQLQKNLMDCVGREVISSGQKEIYEEFVKRMAKRNPPKYEGLVSDDATTVLKIFNIVDKQIIEEDAEYELVYNDLKIQLEKIGKVVSVVIPRLKDKHRDGIGFAYAQFENEKAA